MKSFIKKCVYFLIVICILILNYGCNQTPVSMVGNEKMNPSAHLSPNVQWGPLSYINPNPSTTPLPQTAVVFNGTLYLFFHSNTTNEILYRYTTSETGDSSGPNLSTPATSTCEPNCVVFNGKLYVLYRAATFAGIFYVSMNSSGQWSGPVQLPSACTTPIAVGVAVDYTIDANGPYMHVFYKGNTNNYIYHVYMNASGSWSSYQSTNYTTDGRPCACMLSNNMLLLAYKTLGGSIKLEMKKMGWPWQSAGYIPNVSSLKANQGPCLLDDGSGDLACAWTKSDASIFYACGTYGFENNPIAPYWEGINYQVPGVYTPLAPFVVNYKSSRTFLFHKGFTNSYIHQLVSQ